jgi:hypothetical protein
MIAISTLLKILALGFISESKGKSFGSMKG